jgi:hypothetical protein
MHFIVAKARHPGESRDPREHRALLVDPGFRRDDVDC